MIYEVWRYEKISQIKGQNARGVLAGFAEYLEIDSVWIRIGYALFAFLVILELP